MSSNSVGLHCPAEWGYHDEHYCSIPDDEHAQSPDWHECPCGSETCDEDIRRQREAWA